MTRGLLLDLKARNQYCDGSEQHRSAHTSPKAVEEEVCLRIFS